MKILRSATEHKITERDIFQIYVYGEEFEMEELSPSGNPVFMHVGWGIDSEDLVEVKLEVLIETDEDGEDIVVFHADLATSYWRKKFYERRRGT